MHIAQVIIHCSNFHRTQNDTDSVTAAQQSKAASIAAESEAEKDGGAVTDRKHFPLNVNRTGYIVFSVSVLHHRIAKIEKHFVFYFRVMLLDSKAT